mmetsp:Transcript_9211/g.34026  ORF Transcript_9211/g.34026 Transcript_9211/m.34026 type:complete len:154 (-) Transcript_9211:1324-1785(-)
MPPQPTDNNPSSLYPDLGHKPTNDAGTSGFYPTLAGESFLDDDHDDSMQPLTSGQKESDDADSGRPPVRQKSMYQQQADNAVLVFVIGFLFPIAWIFGAILFWNSPSPNAQLFGKLSLLFAMLTACSMCCVFLIPIVMWPGIFVLNFLGHLIR